MTAAVIVAFLIAVVVCGSAPARKTMHQPTKGPKNQIPPGFRSVPGLADPKPNSGNSLRKGW